jgi:hypothetical protein
MDVRAGPGFIVRMEGDTMTIYEVSLIETTYRRATITVESTSKDSALWLAESRVKEGDWEYREKTVDAVEAFIKEDE